VKDLLEKEKVGESGYFGNMLTLDCQWICEVFWQKSKL
jgi:hypothetical protein